MGTEFGQWAEWNHHQSLDWHLLKSSLHTQLQQWMRDLNSLYKSHPALYESDFVPGGFEWVDTHDWEQSVISFLRKGSNPDEVILAVCNFTPVPRSNYRFGVSKEGFWKELLNSDASCYGGSGMGNLGGVHSEPIVAHGRPNSISLTLPPLYYSFWNLLI